MMDTSKTNFVKRHEPEGETVLTGKLDQAALHGFLIKIRDLGLKLISINRVDATESARLSRIKEK